MQVMTNSWFFNDFLQNHRIEVKILSRKCNGLIKMANYEEVRVKLTTTQLNKLKSAARNKCGTKLRIPKKTFKIKNYQMNYF